MAVAPYIDNAPHSELFQVNFARHNLGLCVPTNFTLAQRFLPDQSTAMFFGLIGQYSTDQAGGHC